MLALFGEGLATAFFPCTLVLAVPGVALTAAGRRHAAFAIGIFLVGLIGSSWLRFSGRIDVFPSPVTGLLLLAAVGLPLWSGPDRRLLVRRTTAGLATGLATGSLWRPCVGLEFGSVLTDLNTSGATGLGQMIVYTIGVTAPLVAVAAAVTAVPREWIDRIDRPLAWFGSGVLGMLGVAVIAGLDDRVINRLFQLSSF